MIKFIKDLFIKNTEFETILDTREGKKACERAVEMLLTASDRDDQLLLVQVRKLYNLDDDLFVKAVNGFYKTQFKK